MPAPQASCSVAADDLAGVYRRSLIRRTDLRGQCKPPPPDRAELGSGHHDVTCHGATPRQATSQRAYGGYWDSGGVVTTFCNPLPCTGRAGGRLRNEAPQFGTSCASGSGHRTPTGSIQSARAGDRSTCRACTELQARSLDRVRRFSRTCEVYRLVT